MYSEIHSVKTYIIISVHELTVRLVAGVDLIGHEADMVRGKTRQRPTGEYVTGLDVFHQLHCLVSAYNAVKCQVPSPPVWYSNFAFVEQD